MSSTIIVALASVILLFLIFIILFIFRERVEVSLEENNIVVLNYPFSKKRIDLNKDLVSWKVQQAYYLRMGVVYSINMLLKNGRRIAVSSRLNSENYNLLYSHLSSRFKNIKEYE